MASRSHALHVVSFLRHARRDMRDGIDQKMVMDNVHEGGNFTGRYAFMAIMACGIAMLGLLQSSAAVVIGAMLISPLMGPIVQLGFSLCVVDFRMMGRSLLALLAGVTLALATATLIVALSPLRDATSEIMARTQPNLFDLLVALFSGLAGGYAVITRKGEAIVGVAIATALMPPLAVVGFGLATQNAAIASGAFFLFMTNLLTIALSVTLIAKWYGFGTRNSPQHTAWQALVIATTFIVLAIPLGIALKRIGLESWQNAQAREVVQDYLEASGGSIERLKVESKGNALSVNALVLVPAYSAEAKEAIRDRLEAKLKRPVAIVVHQTLEASGSLQRDRADMDDLRAHIDDMKRQLVELRESHEALHEARMTDLLRGLSDISIDPAKHRIIVTVSSGDALAAGEEAALKDHFRSSLPDWEVVIESVSGGSVHAAAHAPDGAQEASGT
nr:TIGR00341 family protein [Dyella sp. ASV24]